MAPKTVVVEPCWAQTVVIPGVRCSPNRRNILFWGARGVCVASPPQIEMAFPYAWLGNRAPWLIVFPPWPKHRKSRRSVVPFCFPAPISIPKDVPKTTALSILSISPVGLTKPPFTTVSYWKFLISCSKPNDLSSEMFRPAVKPSGRSIAQES